MEGPGAKLGMYTNASAVAGRLACLRQEKYGRRYKDAIAATGLHYQTLRNYAVLARRLKLYRRRDTLTFQQHATVCGLSDDEEAYRAGERHVARELPLRLGWLRPARCASSS